MNTKRTVKITPVLMAIILASWTPVPVVAQSAAELLEKGIYTEQTVGDLSAAIEIYTQVIEDAEANRPHLAEAQFRLGMCYRKRGNDAQARAALEKLVREFPEQGELVALAKEKLAARSALALEPAPWKDGEYLEYRITLPTGKRIGFLHLTTESAMVDGIEAWRLELRRFVVTNADAYGVSRILVDRHTQRPIRSSFRHGVLGNADATYSPDGVEITGGANDTHVDSPLEIFDNDQSMHLVRMLPLETGYEVSLRLLPVWTGKIVEAGLKVTGKEICQVPAGEFECHRVTLDIGQTSWYSTGPERYPVKVETGGVMVELVEIARTYPETPAAFGLEDFGFSGVLPAGWRTYEHRVPGRANYAMVRLLDPEAEAISAVEVLRCPSGRCPSLQRISEAELSRAEERFDSYELREESWSERTIGGRPAISFVGDYKRSGKPWVQYRLYTFIDGVRLELIFRAPEGHFERLRATFDAIAESLDAE